MSNLIQELARIVRLSLPLMAAQGGLMLMGVVDALMVGRVSSLEMSAVALGNSVASVVLVLGIGLAMGIEPLVAQATGAGEHARARGYMWQGIYVATLAAVPIMLVTYGSTFLFVPFGITDDIASRATAFLLSRMPSILFNCAYAALRAYLSATGRPRPILVAVVVSNLANVVLDYALVFGELGMPRLGAVGAGIATTTCYGLMTLIVALAIWADTVDDADVARTLRKPRRADMKKVAALGWPIGLQISAEVGIFTLVSMLIARFGKVQLAGHQIAITLASMSFMCAVGLANATTSRVGYYVGQGDGAEARRTGFLGIVVGGAFMGTAGVLYYGFHRPLAELFAPTDPEAAAMAAVLIQLVALFSVSDGVQTVAAGALRGAGDTKWTFYANIIGHWVIGLPVAMVLGHAVGLGTVGYWWGLTVGLMAVAIILTLRFVRLSSRPIARV